jgi:hypothetical protein
MMPRAREPPPNHSWRKYPNVQPKYPKLHAPMLVKVPTMTCSMGMVRVSLTRGALRKCRRCWIRRRPPPPTPSPRRSSRSRQRRRRTRRFARTGPTGALNEPKPPHKLPKLPLTTTQTASQTTQRTSQTTQKTSSSTPKVPKTPPPTDSVWAWLARPAGLTMRGTHRLWVGLRTVN